MKIILQSQKRTIFLIVKLIYIFKKILYQTVLYYQKRIFWAIKEENFWDKCISLQENLLFSNDDFFKMLGIQLKYKMRHTFNLDKDKIKITRKIYKDYID